MRLTLYVVYLLLLRLLFGDDVGIEIDEVAKANKLSRRLAIPKRGRSSRYQPYNSQGQPSSGFHQRRGHFGAGWFTRNQYFFGERNFDRRHSSLKPLSRSKPPLS